MEKTVAFVRGEIDTPACVVAPVQTLPYRVKKSRARYETSARKQHFDRSPEGPMVADTFNSRHVVSRRFLRISFQLILVDEALPISYFD